jgi:hypothetical protein
MKKLLCTWLFAVLTMIVSGCVSASSQVVTSPIATVTSPLPTPETRLPTQERLSLLRTKVVPSIIAYPRETPAITPCLSSGDRSALTLTVLKNAKYRLNSVYKNEDAQLENGVYHRPGTSAQNNYIKIDGPTAYGDLNGDGRGDAAVILRDWGGGTGVSVNLAVVIDQNGKPYNIATQALGDRVHILSSCVLSEVVTLNMLVPGPNEGFCCPTQQVQQFSI